jgi:hypothetical protein
VASTKTGFFVYIFQQAEGELIGQRPPSRTMLATMEQRGCAKIGCSDLFFNSAWDHKHVEDWLENLFPKLFTFARYLNHAKSHRTRNMSTWLLLNKEARKLTVVPATHPTGKDLLRYKGREKCSVAESHIYIGMFHFPISCIFNYKFLAFRDTIPHDVYESWEPNKELGDEGMESDGNNLISSYDHD